MFVTTNILSRQKFCRGKQTFVATKDVFVATKIILVADPANDRRQEMGIKCQLALRFQTEGQHRTSPASLGREGGSGGGGEG